jgi:hypothetical protein
LRQDLDRLLQDKLREDQLQHRSIDEPERVIDDLHHSPLSGANDYGAVRPANDEWPIDARRTGAASQITTEVSERDNRLAQLEGGGPMPSNQPSPTSGHGSPRHTIG